jgi:hypothetical protein
MNGGMSMGGGGMGNMGGGMPMGGGGMGGRPPHHMSGGMPPNMGGGMPQDGNGMQGMQNPGVAVRDYAPALSLSLALISVWLTSAHRVMVAAGICSNTTKHPRRRLEATFPVRIPTKPDHPLRSLSSRRYRNDSLHACPVHAANPCVVTQIMRNYVNAYKLIPKISEVQKQNIERISILLINAIDNHHLRPPQDDDPPHDASYDPMTAYQRFSSAPPLLLPNGVHAPERGPLTSLLCLW